MQSRDAAWIGNREAASARHSAAACIAAARAAAAAAAAAAQRKSKIREHSSQNGYGMTPFYEVRGITR